MDPLTDPILKGLESVEEALRTEDFPSDRENLYYCVGDIEIEDGHGKFIAVREVLDEIPETEFASADASLAAIRGAIEKAWRHHHATKTTEATT